MIDLFKFRAECSVDVAQFALAVGSNDPKFLVHRMTGDVYNGRPMPDVEVLIESGLDQSHLSAIASGLTDCHVIAETIKPAQTYTGER